jgi:hypothetical protein
MLDPTVTTTPDTGEPQTKRVDELEPGDWVNDTVFETGDPEEILGVHFLEGASHAVVVYSRTEGPYTKSLGRDRMVELAPVELVEASKRTARRWHLAQQLRELGQLIVDHGELPLPRYSLQISFGDVEPDVAAAIANAIGSKVEHTYGTRAEVVWPPQHLSYQPGVHVTWGTKAAPVETADEAEDPDHGRTTAVAEAKPDTLLVPHGEPHRIASGRASVPTPDGGCE